MSKRLKKITSAAAAIAVTVSICRFDAIALYFDISQEENYFSESERLSMPSDAQISLEAPEFKRLIGQDFEEINDLIPMARYGTIDESIVTDGESDALPESFDMRTEGTINSVKNQGDYGTCWTFTAAASAESSLLDTIPSIDISEWHTAYYPYTGGDQIDLNLNSVGEILEYGGSVFVAANLWAQWIGPINEDKMPYGDETIFNDTYTVNSYKNTADYHLENAYLFDYESDGSNRESINVLVKQFIYDGYAVDISYSTKGYSYATNSAYSLIDPSEANHSVIIAGWDDNYTASNFDGNKGAWLCRNSWDTGFGDDGYFWISYEDTSVCEFGVFDLTDTEEYDTNYQHDSFIPTQTLSAYSDASETGPSYMANIFTAEKTQEIGAVSTYINNPGTEYEVTIYTNLTDSSDPSSGTPSSTTYGSSDLTGYITIELDENVAVKEGEQFAVSVKMYCEDTPFVIPIESCMLLKNRETGEITSLGSYTTYDAITQYTGENESFYSEDGSSWTDVTDENFEYTEEEKNNLLDQIIAESDTLTDEQIENFRDLFDGCDLIVVLGNISLKAYAAQTNSVEFSHISGNVPLDEQVSLSVKSGEEIYCSVNGGEEFIYDSPISITEDTEISATIDHVNYTVRTYTPAKAEFMDIGYFTSLKYTDNNDILYAERIDKSTYEINLSGAESEVKLFAVTAADVWLDGTQIDTYTFLDAMQLDYGLNVVQFELNQDNRLDNTVTLNIYRNPVNIDLETETASFSGLTLTASDGTVIDSGDSVSEYAGQTLTAVLDDGTSLEVSVPERSEMPDLEIDYLNETLNFIPNDIAEFMEFSVDDENYIPVERRCIDGQNITSGMIMNKAFRIIPGETVTLRIAAGNGKFGSDSVTFEISSAGEAPDEEIQYYKEEHYKFTLEQSNTLEYGIIDSSLTEEELSELADSFGYSTDEYVALMSQRFGTTDRSELLMMLAAEWDSGFEIQAEKGKAYAAVRYYSDDSSFASQAKLTELQYVIKGDVNFDNVIDAVDASLVLSYYAANSIGSDPNLTAEEIEASDYNSDNVIDAIDASLILTYYAKTATGQI